MPVGEKLQVSHQAPSMWPCASLTASLCISSSATKALFPVASLPSPVLSSPPFSVPLEIQQRIFPPHISMVSFLGLGRLGCHGSEPPLPRARMRGLLGGGAGGWGEKEEMKSH